ncbi:MAG: pirin family protein, partial [Burkholderiales bacterium]|nr:pirin family protein [Burkholderiales bacterium]
KKVLGAYSAPSGHWVGDGFPVRSIFSYNTHGGHLSPFLLLDYAGPAHFEPAAKPRGVGEHPHRGFETVTIVYDGEVEHRDSTGAGGKIAPGDVQWMTAASGILHEEYHSHDYTRKGGPFEMVQLWVNLPARDKMTEPGYQAIQDAEIPALPLVDAAGEVAGRVRVIAGAYGVARGPARTHTPMNVWDVRLQAGHTVSLAQPEGWTSLLVVLEGTIEVNGATPLRPAQMATLSTAGREIRIEAQGDAKLLLLAGEPIAEPVVGYGPFVMNSQAEIVQAFDDFNRGQFGRMA